MPLSLLPPIFISAVRDHAWLHIGIGTSHLYQLGAQ